MRPSVRRIACAFAVAGLLMWWSPHRSAADEHASHHGGGSSGGMGGEMGGMGEEMEGEHGGRTSQFFPSLINLPELNADQRAQLDQAAQQRMTEGASLMSRGVDLLSNPEDFASMREGTRLIRDGLDEFQSGLVAREALQSGTPPQAVAFNWFRQQLNLPGPGAGVESYTLLGLSPFHLFSMLLLVLVASAAIWIYFLRMHRARALMLSLAPAGAAPPATGAGVPPVQPPSSPAGAGVGSPPMQNSASASVPSPVESATPDGNQPTVQ